MVIPREGVGKRAVDGRGLHHAAGAAIRRMAVERVARGERPSDVMRRFGLCRTTIYRWLRAAERGGPSALEPRPHRGRAPRIAAGDAARVRGALLGTSPRDHGLEGALWTRRTVSRLVERKLGVRLHPVTASRLLARAGLRADGPALSASEAAAAATPALVFAVDGRGAFLCARLEPTAPPESRRETVRALARRAARPTTFRVVREVPGENGSAL